MKKSKIPYQWEAPTQIKEIKVKVDNGLKSALIDLENTCLQIRDKLKINQEYFTQMPKISPDKPDK